MRWDEVHSLLVECFAEIDIHQSLQVRLEGIRKLLDHIALAPVSFEMIEKVWLTVRDLIQREQPKEVLYNIHIYIHIYIHIHIHIHINMCV